MPVLSFPIVDEREKIVDFTAKWITPPGEKSDNYNFLARKEFVVSRIPDRVILRAAADTWYVIYLNGQYIGNGPVRGTHKRYFFDSYDVTTALRQGKNYLAAEVHSPVRPISSLVPSITPAILVQLDKLVKTDSSWQVCVDPSHRADALLREKKYYLQIDLKKIKVKYAVHIYEIRR